MRVNIDKIETIYETEAFQYLESEGQVQEKIKAVGLEIEYTLYLSEHHNLRGNISLNYDSYKHDSIADYEEGIKQMIISIVEESKGA